MKMRMNMASLKDVNLLDVGHTITMVGALYAGKGRVLAVLFPEGSEEAKMGPVEMIDMTHEDWRDRFLPQTDTLPVEAFPDGSAQKAILRKANREVDNNVSWAVYRRDKFTCRYCGKNDVPMTVDHLVRWEERGPWTEVNLLTACRKCNKTRGDMSYADWLKGEFYLRVSRNLTPEVKAANEAILGTLDGIKRVQKMRSR
jgi:HNH endonuclease